MLGWILIVIGIIGILWAQNRLWKVFPNDEDDFLPSSKELKKLAKEQPTNKDVRMLVRKKQFYARYSLLRLGFVGIVLIGIFILSYWGL